MLANYYNVTQVLDKCAAIVGLQPNIPKIDLLLVAVKINHVSLEAIEVINGAGHFFLRTETGTWSFANFSADFLPCISENFPKKFPKSSSVILL